MVDSEYDDGRVRERAGAGPAGAGAGAEGRQGARPARARIRRRTTAPRRTVTMRRPNAARYGRGSWSASSWWASWPSCWRSSSPPRPGVDRRRLRHRALRDGRAPHLRAGRLRDRGRQPAGAGRASCWPRSTTATSAPRWPAPRPCWSATGRSSRTPAPRSRASPPWWTSRRTQNPSAAAQLTLALANQRRYRDLAATGAGTVQERQQADEQVQQARSAVDQAKASTEAARARSRSWTRSARRRRPPSGPTRRRSSRPGSTSATPACWRRWTAWSASAPCRSATTWRPGASLMVVVPLDRIYIVANYREVALRHVLPGQHVRIHVDAYDLDLDGVVDSVPPASGRGVRRDPAQQRHRQLHQDRPAPAGEDPGLARAERGEAAAPRLLRRDHDPHRPGRRRRRAARHHVPPDRRRAPLTPRASWAARPRSRPLLAAGSLAGCTVGPDYHPPVARRARRRLGAVARPTSPAARSTRRSTRAGGTASAIPCCRRWWHAWPAQNLDLQAAAERILQGRAQREVVSVAGAAADHRAVLLHAHAALSPARRPVALVVPAPGAPLEFDVFQNGLRLVLGAGPVRPGAPRRGGGERRHAGRDRGPPRPSPCPPSPSWRRTTCSCAACRRSGPSPSATWSWRGRTRNWWTAGSPTASPPSSTWPRPARGSPPSPPPCRRCAPSEAALINAIGLLLGEAPRRAGGRAAAPAAQPGGSARGAHRAAGDAGATPPRRAAGRGQAALGHRADRGRGRGVLSRRDADGQLRAAGAAVQGRVRPLRPRSSRSARRCPSRSSRAGGCAARCGCAGRSSARPRSTFRRTLLQAWQEVDDALTAYAEAQARRVQLAEAAAQNAIALQVARQRYAEGAGRLPQRQLEPLAAAAEPGRARRQRRADRGGPRGAVPGPGRRVGDRRRHGAVATVNRTSPGQGVGRRRVGSARPRSGSRAGAARGGRRRIGSGSP